MQRQFTTPIETDPIVGMQVTKIEMYPEHKTFRVEYDRIHASGKRTRADAACITDPAQHDEILQRTGHSNSLEHLLDALAECGELPKLKAKDKP